MGLGQTKLKVVTYRSLKYEKQYDIQEEKVSNFPYNYSWVFLLYNFIKISHLICLPIS